MFLVLTVIFLLILSKEKWKNLSRSSEKTLRAAERRPQWEGLFQRFYTVRETVPTLWVREQLAYITIAHTGLCIIPDPDRRRSDSDGRNRDILP